MAEGRFADALARFLDGERLAGALRAPHFLAPILRAWELRAPLPELAPGAQTSNLAGASVPFDDDPKGAAEAVAPVLDGTAFVFHVNVEIEACCSTASPAPRWVTPRPRVRPSSARWR